LFDDYGLRKLNTHLENLNRFLAFIGELIPVFHDDSEMTRGLIQALVLSFRVEVFDPSTIPRFLGSSACIPISQSQCLRILKGKASQ